MKNLASLSSNLPSPIGTGTALAAAASPTNQGPKGNQILRYLNAIKRVKWLVLLLTLVGLGGGYLFSRLRPQQFLVTGQILIAPSESPTFVGDQWSVYFKNYAVITPVVLARRLYIKGPKRIGGPPLPLGPSGPAAALFNGFTLGPSYDLGTYRLKINSDGKTWQLTNVNLNKAEHGLVGDSVGRSFGYAWMPQIGKQWYGQTFEFDVMTPREAADGVLADLTVTPMPTRLPRFLNLTLKGQESNQTAGILNDLMSIFVQSAGVTKRADVTGAVQGLDSQLAIATSRMKDDDRALQQFQIKTITAPRDVFQVTPGLQATTPSAYGTYIQTSTATTQLRNQRRDLKAALDKLVAGAPGATDLYASNPVVTGSSPQLLSFVTELSQDELSYNRLKVSYTDEAVTQTVGAVQGVNMPRLRERIQQLRTDEIPRLTNTVLARLDEDIARGDSANTTQAAELHDIPNRSIAEMELVRSKDNDESAVADLTKQLTAAKARQAVAIPDVQIQNNAVAPLYPEKDKTPFLVAGGAIVGLALGIMIALLLDATDKRVRYADQITSGMGLTILGVIPEIRRAKGEHPSAEEAAQAIEAFRTVRLNLAHALGEGAVLLTISSPSPGDGKSLVSSNLALSFAEAGYRTLLIDGDSRRGELHRTFGADRRPGLLDYLSGELAMDDLLRSTSHPQLKLITGGSRKRNAPELLGTARMRELLAAMREKFDVVLVDTPPLGAGIDPFVLATITGNLMLVLRAGATERDLAEAKLQIVDQLPIRLVGAVLNDVRATMDDYKYYSYSYGYGAVDEAAGALTAGSSE